MNKAEFLNTLKSPFAERYDNFIGGAWTEPLSGKYFDNISPVNGQLICKVARSDEKYIEAAIDAGFDLHVPKPVDFDSLVPIIRRLAAAR